MDKQKLLLALQLSADAYVKKPVFGLTKKEFESRSTQRWATQLVIDSISESDNDPLIVAEDIAHKMDKFACKNRPDSYWYSVGYDTVMWIIDLIIEMEERSKTWQ